MNQIFNSKLLNTMFQSEISKETKSFSDFLMKVEYPYVTEKQRSLDSLLEMAQEDTMFPLFRDSMNTLNEQMLYQSHIHGRDHIERVAFHAFVICVLEKLSLAETQLCLEGAKYHDIGRLNDSADPLHGLIGARRYFLSNDIEKISDETAQIIAFIIAAHSLDDSVSYEVFANLFSIPEEKYAMCKKLLDIVKDADALDRFRLSVHSLNPRFLRTESAKSMIQTAFELFCCSKNAM